MKKFWRILKKVLLITAVLSATTLFVVVLTAAVQKNESLKCKELVVKVDEESGISFITNAEIAERINHLSGGSITGKEISKVDFKTIEREIEKNPFVANAEIFVDQSRVVTMKVEQKRPLLRVINSDGVSYYISEKNERIPLSDNFTPHLAVALGNVQIYHDAKRDSSVQNALYTLMTYVQKDTFLAALVDQVYVNENTELEIMPRTGYHTINFGKVDGEMEEKFNRLKTFYHEGLSKVGWDKYKTINLQFEGQVVCVKRDTLNAL
ncbi:MAG: hypothetical protein U0V74_14750 [Chitinophagales bacterium]